MHVVCLVLCGLRLGRAKKQTVGSVFKASTIDVSFGFALHSNGRGAVVPRLVSERAPASSGIKISRSVGAFWGILYSWQPLSIGRKPAGKGGRHGHSGFLWMDTQMGPHKYRWDPFPHESGILNLLQTPGSALFSKYTKYSHRENRNLGPIKPLISRRVGKGRNGGRAGVFFVCN